MCTAARRTPLPYTLVLPRTVHDCTDHEDNLVLDLAAEVGALLQVSEDIDLTTMSRAAYRSSELPTSRLE